MNKSTLLVQDNNSTPEPGFIKAKLTVGVVDNGFGIYSYGFGSGYPVHGDLQPRSTYTFIDVVFISIADPPIATVGSSDSFYYKGKKYENEDTDIDLELYNDWSNKVGQTVDVYIRGGVKGLISLLQSLFGRLQYVERKAFVGNGKRFERYAQNYCWYLPTPFYYFWMEQLVRFWGDCTTRNRGFSNHTTAVFKHGPFNNCFCQHRCSPVFKNNSYSAGQPKETYICESFRIDLLCRRVFVSGRGCRKNHRPSNRSYVASNATSFKEVAAC